MTDPARCVVVDMLGTRLHGGRVVVLARATNAPTGARWRCRCLVCGHEFAAFGTQLRKRERTGVGEPCPRCRPKRPGTVTRRAEP